VIADMQYPEVPLDEPIMRWFPTKEAHVPHVWWKFSPQLFMRFAEVLGFAESTVSLHEQLYVADGPPAMFTVVAIRKSGFTLKDGVPVVPLSQVRRPERAVSRRPA
jgi:hypothetical protein